MKRGPSAKERGEPWEIANAIASLRESKGLAEKRLITRHGDTWMRNVRPSSPEEHDVYDRAIVLGMDLAIATVESINEHRPPKPPTIRDDLARYGRAILTGLADLLDNLAWELKNTIPSDEREDY